MSPIFLLATAALLPDAAPAPLPKVGDTHEITLTYQTSGKSSEGATSEASGGQAIVERVVAVRADGIELQYDLPETYPPDSRAIVWQFPARIFRPHSGPPRLINRAELETRLEAWLKRAKMNRGACGRWIFTWTANRIECDPQSAVDMVEAFDLGPAGLREGTSFRVAEARAPVPVTRQSASAQGSAFAAEMDLDPDAVRRAQAASEIAAGEMLGEPVTAEAAARKWAGKSISGKISVGFETDPAGRIWRRTKVTSFEIRGPDGEVETSTTTETLKRNRVAGPASRP